MSLSNSSVDEHCTSSRATSDQKSRDFAQLVRERPDQPLLPSLLPPEVSGAWEPGASWLVYATMSSVKVGRISLESEGGAVYTTVDMGAVDAAVSRLWSLSAACLLLPLRVRSLYELGGKLWAVVVVVSAPATGGRNGTTCETRVTIAQRRAIGLEGGRLARSLTQAVAALHRAGLASGDLAEVLFVDGACCAATFVLGCPSQDMEGDAAQLRACVLDLTGTSLDADSAEDMAAALAEAQCGVCGENFGLDELVDCDAGHLACTQCVIRGSKSALPGARFGEIRCFFGCCSFAAAKLTRILDAADYESVLLRHGNIQTAKAVHRESRHIWNRVYSAASSESDPQAATLRAYLEERILPSRCPACGQHYAGFDGCTALSCHLCDTALCAWCEQAASSNDACHAHTAFCLWRSRGTPAGALYASEEAVAEAQGDRKSKMLLAVLETAGRSDLAEQFLRLLA